MDLTVIDELKKGNVQPFYLLYGEESFLIELVLETMKKTIPHPDWYEFNVAIYDLLKTPLETVIEEAESFPFGDGKRLVIAKNAYFLTGSTVKSNVEHSVGALLAFLEHPTDFSSLVLVVPYNKLDERKKVVKEVLKKSKVVQAAPLNPDEWEEWLKTRLREKNIVVDNLGLEYLLRYLPSHLQIVENELEKLSLYAHNQRRNTVSLEELQLVISRSVEGNVFDLVEKIANRNFQAAYEIYLELVKLNEEPIKILALLARQFRMILQSKVMVSIGYTQKQIAAHLKVHPYPIKIAVDQGRQFSENDLLEILQHIAELDYKIKTGQVDRHFGLEMLLLQIQAKGKMKK